MSIIPHVKGWCPGALRPMESGDGLIVRLRVTGGILTTGKARAIAQAAVDYGNGLIDLSARANLQIRGVTQESWPALIDALARHDLIDDDEASESVRNVMASPLAGLDPTALIDITPAIHALEHHLITTKALHNLPAKFGFLIDDGGAFPINNHGTDIGFEAVKSDHKINYAVRLAGTDQVALIDPSALVTTADRLARLFIDAAHEHDKPLKRMSDLVARVSAPTLFARVGLKHIIKDQKKSTEAIPLGYQIIEHFGFLGVASPFGRWQAATLDKLAACADDHGVSSLRLTPWRAILLPGVIEKTSQQILSTLFDDVIMRGDDARLSIAACSGAPACHHARVETQKDALLIADMIKAPSLSGIRLHVSGCEKGCAHPRSSTAVLVGRDGHYDLVLEGKASDHPVMRGLEPSTARKRVAEFLNGVSL